MLLDVVVAALDEDGIRHEPFSGETTLRVSWEGEHGRWGCYLRTREQFDQLLIYSVPPFKVRPESRESVTRFITLVNFGMMIGNFEMDLDDGEIRYKTSVAFGETPPTVGMVKQALYSNLVAMDRYLPGIVAVDEGSDPDRVLAGLN